MKLRRLKLLALVLMYAETLQRGIKRMLFANDSVLIYRSFTVALTSMGKLEI